MKRYMGGFGDECANAIYIAHTHTAARERIARGEFQLSRRVVHVCVCACKAHLINYFEEFLKTLYTSFAKNYEHALSFTLTTCTRF